VADGEAARKAIVDHILFVLRVVEMLKGFKTSVHAAAR
jgi:hypothetical protein